ncbi:MAG TPA: DUF6511 domain-containing protein [Ramlibacter sp.]|jgi:hypothetical protein
MQHDRHSDRVCGVCARPAIGIGVAPSNARRLQDLIWLCNDPECIEIGNKTMGLKQLEFSRLDSLATMEAGSDVERYCDEIGKTDLREFTQQEWDNLCRRFVAGYRDALQTKLRDEAPF